MTFLVFISVLGAALLHAGWNASIKSGADKQAAMMMMSVGQGLIGLPLILMFPWPPGAVWPWLLASGAIHGAYQLFLSFAYDRGDLSRVYPIARGGAPLMVLVVSLIVGLDNLAGFELVGILVLGCGIVLMAHGAFASGEDRRMIPLALGSACATAGYSLVDGLGARVWGEPFAYVSWLLILSTVFYVPAAVAFRGTRVLVVPRAAWGMGLLAGLASFMAYAIVVWAMTQAPIALVTALRETSILFAVLIGWILFGEKIGAQKWAAAAFIVLGLGLTRLVAG